MPTLTSNRLKGTALQFSPSRAPTLRIFIDSNGAAWVRTYTPLDTEELSVLREFDADGDIELIEEPLPSEDEALREMAWFQDHISDLMGRHPGEWVAVSPDGLVAHGTDLSQVMAAASKAGVAHPFVSLVPKGKSTRLYA